MEVLILILLSKPKSYFNKILKESKNLKIITVGTKGLDQLKREYGKYIIKKIDFKNKKKISFKDASLVGDEIVKLFKNNEFDKCIIFYNKFKNVNDTNTSVTTINTCKERGGY